MISSSIITRHSWYGRHLTYCVRFLTVKIATHEERQQFRKDRGDKYVRSALIYKTFSLTVLLKPYFPYFLSNKTETQTIQLHLPPITTV